MIKCLIINSTEGEYVPETTHFYRWANAIKYENEGEVTIKIITPDEMRGYNKLFKNQDKVSDTLAFPADNIIIENKVILGDIAMCASKINSDSELYNKKRLERWAHLTIHSLLHIYGYDHDSKTNREKMEDIEIDILKGFNIFNPYEI